MEQSVFIFCTNVMAIVQWFCFIGFVMGLQRTNNSELDCAFNKARIWMAAGSFFLACESLVHKYVLGPDAPIMTLQLMVLFGNYAVGRMITFGLSPSFDRNYISPKRVSFIMSRVVVVGILTLVVLLAPLSARFTVVLIVVIIAWVAIDTTCMIIYVLHSYGVARKAFDEFYSEDYDRYLRWTPAILLILLVFALGWNAVLFAPLAFQGIYALIGATLWFYMFMYYERHSIYFRYRKTDTVIRIPEPDTVAPEQSEERRLLSEDKVPAEEMGERYTFFVGKLAEWVDNKGYYEPDLTIEQLARMFMTNRTYLSAFINTHYGMSFCQWIASLRIADAKKLLVDTSLKEQDIADRLGFASLQSFIRTFTQQENLSPSAYRRKFSARQQD